MEPRPRRHREPPEPQAPLATEPGAAGLDPVQLLDLYRWMYLVRASEERLEVLQKQGHLTTNIYRSLGQEAGSVGAAYAMRRRDDGTGDVVAHTVREIGALFLFGATPLDLFRQYMGRRTAPSGGRDGNVHWSDYRRGFVGPVSPLGTMLGVMAGVTLSFRLRGEDRVGMVFAGDGASSTGAWHEGFGFAAAQRCPLVLMVEANQWAFSTPTSGNTRVTTFADKAPSYGIEAVSVDGTDVVAVYDATRAAVERARSGEGTQMVEMRYFRRRGHAQHDPQDYVDPEVLEAWERRDPLELYRARLVEERWAGEAEIERVRAEVEAEVVAAADQVIAEPQPNAEDATELVYTDVRIPVPWTRRTAADPLRDP